MQIRTRGKQNEIPYYIHIGGDKYDVGGLYLQTVNSNPFTVKETDFLLKLLMGSQFHGNEVEVVYSVTKKLSEMHREKLEA